MQTHTGGRTWGNRWALINKAVIQLNKLQTKAKYKSMTRQEEQKTETYKQEEQAGANTRNKEVQKNPTTQ